MAMASSSVRNSRLNSQQKQSWIVILGFALFVALVFLVRAGRFLVPIFPLGSLAIGLFLYRRTPVLYVGFTWWLTFLGPCLRRLIDYQSGQLTYGPWTLTPVLVASISGLTLVRYLPRSYKLGGLPFLLCLGSVIYGFLIGLGQNSANGAVNNLLSWASPILFGFHLFINWRDYPQLRQSFQRTFLWGVLVMGVYGIFQYLIAPEWDRFWLENIDTTSFGKPEPLGIRVVSTMESPQGFASVMGAGLLFLFANQGNLRFPAAGVGYLTFLLSLARSAWLGWFAGLLAFIPSLKPQLQMRLIVSIIVATIFVVPLVTLEPFTTVISPRLETLTNLEEDRSLQSRSEGYNELLGLALANPLGKGLGYTTNNDIYSIGSNDSGILSMLFTLGWFGTISYLSGILLLFFKLFQSPEGRSDTFVSAVRAIALGTAAQFGANVVTAGSLGLVLWGCLGMGLASYKYYFHQRTSAIAKD